MGSNLDFQSTLIIKNLAAPTNTGDAARKGYVDTEITNAKSRANHTGTQLAATISDFDTAVRLSRLDQMAAPTAAVNLNSQRITSLQDPSGAQDAATKNYVDTQISGLTGGLVLKGAVRAVSSTNVNIASPGATIDGVSATANDVFLLAGQTTGSQNGPWVWNGSAVAMTRPTNWDTAGEAVVGSYWVVKEGTQADKFAIMTNDSFTLNTTTAAFSYVGSVSSTGAGFTTTSPSVTAGGSWTVSHALNTKTLVWQVYRTASPYDDIDVYGERTDVNTLTLKPDIAMASGEYTVVVWKAA